MRKLTKFLLPVSAVALVLPGLSTVAQAQGADDEIEEIVVSGLRGKPRSAVDSAVPIDTFDTEAIEAVAHTDTVDILQTLVPSYNVSREPISDGSSFIRPAELRGLPTHHTLVLINGKRRHRASLVGIGGNGEQGPDIATIPSTAIQSVEVLRDGASSQYGSDAIAGVINFNLKDNNEGVSLVARTGSYSEGDGDSYTIAGNVGLSLGDSGFVSFSAEYDQSDFTQRDEQYCESWFCVDPTNRRFGQQSQVRQDFVNGVATPGERPELQALQLAFPAGIAAASVAGDTVQPWGQPNIESVRTFVNAGYELGNGMDLYGFANYSDSKGDGGFFYRYPGNGTIEFVRNADGSLYNPLEKFPGGFTPRFEGQITDIGALGGLRGETDGGFAYDFSLRFGSNEIDYRLFNTVNPSYGVDSPTDFRPGTLTNEELQFQVDLSNEFDAGLASPMVFAYGISYMDESYDVGQSADVPSYDAGPHALQDPYGFCDNGAPSTVAGGGVWTSSIGGMAAVAGNTIAGLDCNPANGDPVFTVVGVGANGFPGYSPAFSEKYSRDSYAVYGDLSADFTDNLFLQAAIRYEDYSDFGDELVGKIAGRLRLNDSVAIRASYGTGFRAPTPGQQGTTNVSTRLPNGFPVATGLFPPESSVSQALGASPLRAETSTSYTLGLTATIEDLTVTVDFYHIEIDDRFRAISTLDVSTDPGAGSAYTNYLALVAAGVSGAESIGGVFYFTNAFDSETTGVDVVASYPIAWDNGQDTTISFALNYNTNKLASDASDFLNDEDQFDFEHFDPNIRWNATINHSFSDKFSIMARARYYGESENGNNSSDPLDIQRYSSTSYLDLEGTYRVNDTWSLSLGGRNVTEAYPDKLRRNESGNDNCCGRVYPSGTVVPWQGAYYYGAVRVSF
jgi:iron complex outermembrane receptor protein